MEEIDLETLLFKLKLRLKTGVEVFNGIPYIHGHPAVKDTASSIPSLIDTLSEWCCPHCNSHLAKESFICLNGCHLTAPQYKTMQAKIMQASAKVDKVKSWVDGLYDDVSDFPEWFEGFTDVYYHEVSDSIELAELKDYFLKTISNNYKGLGLSHTGQRYGLFKDKNDYVAFKLRFG